VGFLERNLPFRRNGLNLKKDRLSFRFNEKTYRRKIMKLSDQAITCLMGALQKCILEQTDITNLLRNFDFDKAPENKRWGGNGALVVTNPPTIQMQVPQKEDK